MRQLTFSFMLIFLALSAIQSQTQVSGSVFGTWTLDNSPYIATNNIKIEKDDSLLIEPGVQILFDGHFSLRADGYLYAVGTKTDSILFSNNHQGSMWAGIGIYNDKNSSTLEFCRIEHSDQSGINIYDASPKIRFCHILNNTDSGTQNHIGEGGGIDVHYADPVIEFNLIENNSSDRGGGIHIYEDPNNRPGQCRIYNNIIRFNTATWGGGIRVFTEGAATTGAKCTPIIRNNVLDGNSVADPQYGGNIYIFPGAKPEIINNIVINSPNGGGILDLSSSIIQYNDVWNNKPYNYIDATPGLGDFSANPLFIGGSPFDYHLTSSSPCIDAGHPAAPLDPDNSRADVGVFYFGTDAPPLGVTDLTANAGHQRITLSWYNPNIIDYDYTLVVRGETSYSQNPGDGFPIYSGARTICQDTSLVNNKTYFYSVFVFDKAGMVSQPAHISAQPEHHDLSVLRVPWDFLKIQDAMNAADQGDTVLVWPGTYSPSANGESFPIVMADNVVLMSKDGRENTTIDAEQTNLVMLGANYCTLEGFTIRNGWNSSYSPDNSDKVAGGGVLCRGIIDMKIIDNIIEKNSAFHSEYWNSGYGGGIYCADSKVDIIGNIIRDNRTGSECGGIGYTYSSNPLSPPRILILDNLIIRNDAGNAGGIGIGGVHAVIKNNVIALNKVHVFVIPTPGGIHLDSFYWGSAEIINNTIAYNYNVDMPGNISGIYYKSGSNPITLKNNIVWGHREDEVVIGNTVASSGAKKFIVSYSCIEGGYPGIGNNSDDPQFIDVDSHDYHLTANSPCIDAGDPNLSLDPDCTRADIGSFYFHHADLADIEIARDQIIVHADENIDTTLQISISNKGTRSLGFKIYDKSEFNNEDDSTPDEYGYSWINSDNDTKLDFEWIDIKNVGTELGYSSFGKNYGPFPLGFDFVFYDYIYSSIRICSEGFQSFMDNDHGGWNHPIPFELGPKNLVATFWDDFDASGGNRVSKIYFWLDEKNKRFIVQYDSLLHADTSLGYETFQTIFEENGSILFNYRNITSPNNCTVGIQNNSGYFGLQVVYNHEFLHSNQSIRIFQGAEWLELAPQRHNLDPGEFVELPITISTHYLNPGSYNASILIESNDNDQATVKIPVYLNVNPTGGDFVRPYPVTDLSLASTSDSTVTLYWTATGDDSTTGVASYYDLRFQTKPPAADTLVWWENAQKHMNMPAPSPAGQRDSVVIKHLTPAEVYYFALKVGDDAGNWSDLSDIVYILSVPVEFAVFEARVADTKIILNWKTCSESNNLGFEVQRKSAQFEFQNIGFIKGFGTPLIENRYTFVDEKVEAGQLYQYRLKQIDTNGSCTYSNIVEASAALPKTYALHQNYPNPFNPSTTIKYELPKEAHVTLTIFNSLGQEVERLVDENKVAGYYKIEWNALDKPTGVYFIVMQSNDFHKTRKLLLMR
ncbi:T9SS type A sorting domain-containing protein [candidate division KSB1 bacterium]|nr:T9SS type A sorting domain-containing protein [candidate division KSB1 bacterium]